MPSILIGHKTYARLRPQPGRFVPYAAAVRVRKYDEKFTLHWRCVMREIIEVGYQTFVSDGGEEFGAVRQVAPQGRPELVIYVENAGDFVVPLDAVEAVHAQKVILSCRKLDRRLREAIGHAHDAEVPGA